MLPKSLLYQIILFFTYLKTTKFIQYKKYCEIKKVPFLIRTRSLSPEQRVRYLRRVISEAVRRDLLIREELK
jgi:hypothetical protein